MRSYSVLESWPESQIPHTGNASHGEHNGMIWGESTSSPPQRSWLFEWKLASADPQCASLWRRFALYCDWRRQNDSVSINLQLMQLRSPRSAWYVSLLHCSKLTSEFASKTDRAYMCRQTTQRLRLRVPSFPNFCSLNFRSLPHTPGLAFEVRGTNSQTPRVFSAGELDRGVAARASSREHIHRFLP